jgi:hypothetical protein
MLLPQCGWKVRRANLREDLILESAFGVGVGVGVGCDVRVWDSFSVWEQSSHPCRQGQAVDADAAAASFFAGEARRLRLRQRRRLGRCFRSRLLVADRNPIPTAVAGAEAAAAPAAASSGGVGDNNLPNPLPSSSVRAARRSSTAAAAHQSRSRNLRSIIIGSSRAVVVAENTGGGWWTFIVRWFCRFSRKGTNMCQIDPDFQCKGTRSVMEGYVDALSTTLAAAHRHDVDSES